MLRSPKCWLKPFKCPYCLPPLSGRQAGAITCRKESNITAPPNGCCKIPVLSIKQSNPQLVENDTCGTMPFPLKTVSLLFKQFVDYHTKSLVPKLDSYVHDTSDFLSKLEIFEKSELPPIIHKIYIYSKHHLTSCEIQWGLEYQTFEIRTHSKSEPFFCSVFEWPPFENGPPLVHSNGLCL